MTNPLYHRRPLEPSLGERTKRTILTDLARAQNSGDNESQKKLQAEYDKLHKRTSRNW